MSNKEGLFVAAKGGHNNENHNHNDVGNFIFYVNSVPLFMDVGVGSYTAKTFGPDRYSIWTMQSNYHNLPLINGVAQRPGKIFKASNTQFNPKKKVFSTDIATAYPQTAQVKSWVRTYQLKKKGLSIKDQFSLSKILETNTLTFMTWGEINIEQPGEIVVTAKGESAKLLYDKNLFEVSKEAIELDDRKLSKVWGSPIFKLSLKAKTMVLDGHYAFDIVAE